MAWNPSPEVKQARHFASKFKARRVIIYYELEDGRVGGASYGKNRKLCDETGAMMDEAFPAVERLMHAKE